MGGKAKVPSFLGEANISNSRDSYLCSGEQQSHSKDKRNDKLDIKIYHPHIKKMDAEYSNC